MTGKQAVNYLYSSGFSDEQVKTVVEAIRKDPCLESGWYEGMNKEESLDIIKAYRDKLKNSASNQLEDDIAAFDVAIEALKIESCEDAISRVETVKFLANHSNEFEDVKIRMAFLAASSLVNNLHNLPPVNPQPKTGQFAKWVAREIFDDEWEYNKDAFAELACRKLAKLGIVRANGDEWELVEPQESEEN